MAIRKKDHNVGFHGVVAGVHAMKGYGGRTVSEAKLARRLGGKTTVAKIQAIVAGSGATYLTEPSAGLIKLTDAGLQFARRHPSPRSWFTF